MSDPVPRPAELGDAAAPAPGMTEALAGHPAFAPAGWTAPSEAGEGAPFLDPRPGLELQEMRRPVG